MRKFAITFILFTFFVMAVPMQWANAVDVGGTISHKLNSVDDSGAAQDFSTVVGENGAVLVFIRSADWCPFCQAQLLDLAEQGEEITKYGYNIVIISYDAPEKLQNFKKKYDYPYVMLSDEGSEIIKTFGILNEEMAPDSAYYGIPHPTVYVVGHDSYVQGVLAEEGYKDRPQVEAILEVIKASQF